MTYYPSGKKLPYQEAEAIYQKTEEYDKAIEILEKNHVVLINGEPGLGKTTLAYKLANEFAGRHYHLEIVGGENSHLNIIRACHGEDNVLLLLDDAFGYEEYLENLGTPLGNNFEQIISQLSNSNGRVKVIMTSRQNVLARVADNTKLSTNILSRYLVLIPFSTSSSNVDVLKAHFAYLQINSYIADAVFEIQSLFETFENLYHVRSFAYAFCKLEERPSRQTILTILEETRPSLYIKWIEKQPVYIQLFLVVLWLITDVNQFAIETHVQNIFNVISHCIALPAISGFSKEYDASLRGLLESDRVLLRRNNIIDFVHPTLKIAVARFFENIPNKQEFIICAVDSLSGHDNPLAQSVAVYLAIRCLDDDNRYEKLSRSSDLPQFLCPTETRV